MQWLIDIVKELIHGQLGYFNRGDNVPNDFISTDLTRDGNWHELDLSGIVPENTRAVNLKVNIRATAVELRFEIRAAGQVNTSNSLSLWTQVSGIRLGGLFPVNCNSDRIIEYRAAIGGWQLLVLNVNGWWLR